MDLLKVIASALNSVMDNGDFTAHSGASVVDGQPNMVAHSVQLVSKQLDLDLREVELKGIAEGAANKIKFNLTVKLLATIFRMIVLGKLPIKAGLQGQSLTSPNLSKN